MISGSAARTPGTEATFVTVSAGSQTRSPSGFSFFLVLVLSPFCLTVTWWTFWSPPTITGA